MPRRRHVLAAAAAVTAATLAWPAIGHAAGPGLALATIVDGEVLLIRGDTRYALAEGVPLRADDIIELPESGGRLLRIEFADGATLDLGPGARLLLAPALGAPRGPAIAYLQQGWAKLGGARGALLTPLFDTPRNSKGGNAVLALLPDGAAQAFAEAGELTLRFTELGNTTLTLRQGEWMNLGTGRAGKPALSAHPGAEFVRQVPRAFLDPLPSRAALLAAKPRDPKPVGAISYADAKPWIDHADPALRRLAVLRWKGLAKKPDFRAGLVAGIKIHPEWQVVLYPPD